MLSNNPFSRQRTNVRAEAKGDLLQRPMYTIGLGPFRDGLTSGLSRWSTSNKEYKIKNCVKRGAMNWVAAVPHDSSARTLCPSHTERNKVLV